jgi:limonene 1,2-monooxygenase
VAGSWKVAEEAAAENGGAMSREDLRVVVNFHLAESREEALKQMEFGVDPWVEYLGALNPKAYAEVREKAGSDIGKFVDSRGALAGTPDDAVEFLEKLWDKTGGFGCLLLTGTNGFIQIGRTSAAPTRPRSTRQWRPAAGPDHQAKLPSPYNA